MKINLAVLVPSKGTWCAEFGESMFNLATHLCTRPIEGVSEFRLQSCFGEGSALPMLRQDLVELAIGRGATHLLFLDSDMVFPPDILHRLLAHRKEIVLCDYPTRRPPFRGTAMLDEAHNPVPDEATGLHEVIAGGLGCALIHARVFYDIPKPWFQFEYEAGRWRSEDFYLFRKAREAGLSVFCDADVSRGLGHMGAQVFRF